MHLEQACAAGSKVCGEQRVEKEDTERVRYPAGAADCTGAGAVSRAAEAGDDTGERASGWFDTIWADDLPQPSCDGIHVSAQPCGQGRECFSSVRTINRDLKLSMSTVRQALGMIWSIPVTYKAAPRWELTESLTRVINMPIEKLIRVENQQHDVSCSKYLIYNLNGFTIVQCLF